MKVAYVLGKFPSASETFALREIQGLKGQGWDIFVLAAESGGQEATEAESVPVVYRPGLLSMQTVLSLLYLLWRYPLALGRLLLLLTKVLADSAGDARILIANVHTIAHFARHLDRQGVRHIHAYFFSWPACIGLAVSVATGRSFSIAAHARDILVEPGAARVKAGHARFIVTCTEQGRTHLERLLPTELHGKICRVYHGIDTESIDEQNQKQFAESDQERLDILAVGRLVPKKGFDGLLRAYKSVFEKYPNCRLRIVGDGPEYERLHEVIGQEELGSCVQLIGWKSNGEILRMMRSSTLLVVPSVIAADGDMDGIPNVILEAFASRLPVVASALPGIAEAVRHNDTGLLVEPGDIGQLSEAVLELLSSPSTRERLSRRAQELVCEAFGLTRSTARISSLLQDAAA